MKGAQELTGSFMGAGELLGPQGSSKERKLQTRSKGVLWELGSISRREGALRSKGALLNTKLQVRSMELYGN